MTAKSKTIKSRQAKTAAVAKKAARGSGVGALVQKLLLLKSGLSYAAIAERVNAKIDGAATTARAVAWYACKMTGQGIELPARARAA
jgi:hypothetical protein